MPPVVAIRSHDDKLSSPLGQHILNYEPPQGFDKMLHYNQAMTLNASNDHLLCKVFPASLQGPVLAWFHKFPHNSVNSFNELCIVDESKTH